MAGYVGSPFSITPVPFAVENVPDLEVKTMKPSLAELMLMSSLVEPYGSKPDREPVTSKPCGLRGKDWDKRKARSKISKASRKRNRK